MPNNTFIKLFHGKNENGDDGQAGDKSKQDR